MWDRTGRSGGLACWVALLLTGCGAPTALPPAAAMLGAWSYNSAPVSPDRPSLNAGIHVSLAVDSVEGKEFSGRVTLWFAGDVGIAPDAFGPLSGSVDGAGGVTLLIRWAAAGQPTLRITGVLADDMLTVHESWFGTAPGPFPPGEYFRRAH